MTERNELLEDQRLQKMVKFVKKLERYYKTGKIDKESYEDKKKVLNLKFDDFRQRKLKSLREERARLSKEIDKLRENFRAKVLDEESYARGASIIKPNVEDIDAKIELMESLELWDYLLEKKYEVKSAEAHEGIPKSLKVIIGLSAVVTVLVLLFFSGVFLTMASKLPLGLDRLGSIFMGAVLILALIGILMNSLILWISAKLTGIKASYFRSLEVAISIAVVAFALNIALGIISIPILLLVRFLTPVIFLLRIVANIAVYLWILRSFFNTTWKKSTIVGLIPLAIAILIFLLLGFSMFKVISSIKPPVEFPQYPGQLPPFKMPPGLRFF